TALRGGRHSVLMPPYRAGFLPSGRRRAEGGKMRQSTIFLLISVAFAGPAAAQTAPVPIPQAKPAAPAAPRAAIHAVSRASEPTFDEGTYQRISATMLSYASLEVRGGWPTLPANLRLAPGSKGPEVALLRRRLVISDDLEPEKIDGEVYDDAVVEGVK